jgi:hypothetical protein
VQFLSLLSGFALVNDDNPNAFSTTMDKTSDSGLTWQNMKAEVMR